MKVKLLTVLGIVIALFISAVCWRVDSFVYGDRLSWVEAQSRTQASSISGAVTAELKSLQRWVSSFNVDTFQKDRISWNLISPYYAVVSFNLNDLNIEPHNLFTRERSAASGWTMDFVKKALGKLDSPAGQGSQIYIKPFQDSNKGHFVALLFVQGNHGYALFGSGEFFQSLIDAQKGSLNSFSLITSSGLTVGHSIPEYVGTVMSDDPIFKEAQRSGASEGTGTFKTDSGNIFGLYEQIPQTNLYVLSSASMKDAMKGRGGLLWQFFLMGCGLGCVGLAAMLFVIVPQEKKTAELEEQLLKVQIEAVVPRKVPNQEKAVLVDPESTQKEKMQAYMRVAGALGHELRGPLTSILGYTQMILAKTQDAELVKSADSILRESRGARDILDKLFSFAGEKTQEKNTMKVEAPLARALKNVDPFITQKGVRLVRNFQETLPLSLNVESLGKAFENILINAVESMERMPKKEIKLDLTEDNQGIYLTIKDCGEGIEADKLDRIFDPFFTTRSFQNHMGMGLAVALGILKEHNAEVQVTSERGKGTEVRIVFKKQMAPPALQSVTGNQSVLKAPVAKAPAKETLKEPMKEVVEEVVVMSRELPKMQETHPEIQAAKDTFIGKPLAAAAEARPASPTDMDIETLLEMPEEEALVEVVVDTDAEISLRRVMAEAPLIEEKPPAIAPPKMAAKAKIKESDLDSYHVEIRRPGKRV